MTRDFVESIDTLPHARAIFIGRVPGLDVNTDRETALARLGGVHSDVRRESGFAPLMATAEQVHGIGVAVVGGDEAFPLPGVDALATASRAICLGIYVADCAPVFFADRLGRAVAVAHSGRKGTEAGIVPATVDVLRQAFGIPAADLSVCIGPCIRPPHYETDFAATIRSQLAACGVSDVRDDRVCTASAPHAYYSYRRESGRTGRMLAVMQAVDSAR